MKHLVLALVLLVGTVFAKELPIAVPQFARNHELWQAADLYRNGWKDSARELARPLADKGDKDAWYLLGLLLEDGTPPRLSRAQAMDFAYRTAASAGHVEARLRLIVVRIASTADENAWKTGIADLEAIAEKGDPAARRILGEISLRGLTDGKGDVMKAREFWRRAAEHGDVPSLILLAKLAEGVIPSDATPDLSSAIQWYRKAADAGNTAAALRLGQLLSSSNPEEARRWIGKAISAGTVEGHSVLADLLLAKDPKQARIEYEKGVEAEDSHSMVKLAAMLMEDDAERTDAIRLLERSAALQNADACARLADIHIKDSPAKAYPYLIDSARNGITRSQAELAGIYLNGTLGKPDPQAAVAWLTEAMKSGDADIQYLLGTLHEQGIGTPVNYANAGTLYTMACNKGNAPALARIAHMADEGLGTKMDPVQAWAYASLAIERGDRSSAALLAGLDKKLDDAAKGQAREVLAKLRADTTPGARN